MTETRFYEPARLGTPPESSFSLKLLDTNLVEVIVNRGLPCVKAMSIITRILPLSGSPEIMNANRNALDKTMLLSSKFLIKKR